MSTGIDVSKLNTSGEELLQKFVEKMGLEGAVIATAEGLEMASYFVKDRDAELIAADTASLLSTVMGALEDTEKGALNEMIISGSGGFVAVKDLGEEIALAVLTSSGYKMGGLVIALKQFVKDIQAF
ncbi:roadblock/LC7 domain-containing protein [Sulfurovum sp.]|uniref:roadblock/LC7 domain-containing protein n=1 Tax=Sulfurovum sp. TaxID=1969726 RepID=UPI0025D311C3|nr:roadblock/LC7 domain-containing protein [Sulfurovum sp.]